MQKSSAWLIGALITIAVGAIAANTDAKPHPAPAPVLAKAVPAGVCPPGHSAFWINASTHECLRELP
ncbi:hypothetical protein COAQ111491_21790 [Comamonas aquatilis]|uniref:hypothetical protein n=1 Tax=Comamonas aquatilis TaxID=1778406 RepID=UPI0039F043B7